jgi:hypothetical protein
MLAWAVVGLVVLVAASPTLVRLMDAAVPLVIVVGVVVAALRAVFYVTRGW